MSKLRETLNKIEDLKTELSILERGITPDVSNGNMCIKLTKDLHKDMTDPEVKELQIFLAQDSTIYPEAIISGYYGALTEKAVKE